MRIIAGMLRGRTLAAPRDLRTRPMLEKTRGALFNILGEQVEGRRVLDLFAGTGSLGIEALSRGAAWVTFVERDAGTLRCLERNRRELGIEGRSEVWGMAVEGAVARAAGRGFDLVFLDPPYRFAEGDRERSDLLGWVRRLWGEVLVAGGILALHFPAGSLGGLQFAPAVPRTVRTYGRNAIAVFERERVA